jgi:uncharacterized membrane protein
MALFLAFMVLSTGLLTVGLIAKKSLLCSLAGVFWIFFGVTAYQSSTGDQSHMDIYLAMWFLAVVMILVSFISGVNINMTQGREKKEQSQKIIIQQKTQSDQARRSNIATIRRVRQERKDSKLWKK